MSLNKKSKAKQVFLNSFKLAIERFVKKPTKKTRELLQHASMNMGIYYRLEGLYEKARPYFVYALELSPRIARAVLFR